MSLDERQAFPCQHADQVSYIHNLQSRISDYERRAALANKDSESRSLNQDDGAVRDNESQPRDNDNMVAMSRQDDVVDPSTPDVPKMMNDTAAAVDHVPNPLAPQRPSYALDSQGRMRYLGHSSTWSFNRQVLYVAEQHSAVPNFSPYCEGDAYDLGLKEILPADLTGLPSKEVSLYLLQTIKFRTCSLFHLFDDADFGVNIDRFYENPTTFERKSRIWFVHYLVLMAIGKALVSNVQAGAPLFARALRLLPDVTTLCSQPIVSSELLCSITLYLQCLDHRTSAHIYIGQAMRVAISHGLHWDVQAQDVGENLVHRCRRIWWTVYALDRRLSALCGTPNSLRDEDITTPLLPDANDPAFFLGVKISQLFGNVLSTVYSVDGKLAQKFSTTVHTTLRAIAVLSDELASFSEQCFGEVSRAAAHLNIAYHQCIILTTRPFLFALMQRRLADDPFASSFRLTASAKGLVQVCIDSAMQVLTILSNLQQHDLIDAFLPFDLDSAVSAAFVLLMAANVHPKLLPNREWLDVVYEVFDNMTSKGNALAPLRRLEVEELDAKLKFPPKPGNQEAETADHSQKTPVDHASLPSLGDPFFDQWNQDDGLSGEQIMSLADELQDGSFAEIWLQNDGFQAGFS